LVLATELRKKSVLNKLLKASGLKKHLFLNA